MGATDSPMLQGLLGRHSQGIKHLAEPGPDEAQLLTMTQAALRAPDHAGLVPFRFKVVGGLQRDALAELFAHAARDAGKDAATVALDAERARRAPVTVALVARIDMGHPLVPAHEQWAAVGGALANFLNAAHALGFAGKMLSGAKARHPRIVAAFCAPGETLVGWVALGTATRQVSARGGKLAPEQVMTAWSGLSGGGFTPTSADAQ
jgi:nitroreductase